MNCLAGLDHQAILNFNAILAAGGSREQGTIVDLNVAALAKLSPQLLVCDIDHIAIDRLEFLRRVRFVLPNCIIAVYSNVVTAGWAASCHLAGVSCMLSKNSNAATLAEGLATSQKTGCYTDIEFGRNEDLLAT
jgi:DNA-binding NarL/FixJ family response regulator